MLAEDAARYVAAEGHGTFGSDIVVGFQPDKPDRIAVFDDESAPVLPDSQGYSVQLCGVGVTVRSKDYADARDWLEAINGQLVGFGNGPLVVGGKEVTCVQVVTVPTSIGVDEDQRHEHVAHYAIRYATTGDVHRAS